MQSSNHNTLILVAGATGKQGGAVARHLLRSGFKVKALTRNAQSPAAKQLVEQGAEIVVGNLNDRVSLQQAVAGVDGVFSVQNYWEKGVGYEGEMRQGKNLADAVKATNVQHFVQSTMADGRTFPQQLEHFKSKAEVEKYVKEIGLPYTFLGTVTFMDNVLDPKFGGAWTFPTISETMKPDMPYHMLAINDLGGIAAAVFAEPERFLGQKINCVSDAPTVAQMKEIYRQVTGKSPKLLRIPTWIMRMINQEFTAQLEWQNQGNWNHNPESVKPVYPNLTSFEQFLRTHNVTNL